MTDQNKEASPKAQLIAFSVVVGIFITLYLTMCGGEKDKVSNSPIDASVYQVKEYVESVNIGRYSAIEWSEVLKQDNGNFIVRHKYSIDRVTYNEVFTLNSNGNIINSVDF